MKRAALTALRLAAMLAGASCQFPSRVVLVRDGAMPADIGAQEAATDATADTPGMDAPPDGARNCASVLMGECDPIAATGCMPGTTCRVSNGADGGFVTACSSNGTVGPGGACMNHGVCGEGLACVNDVCTAFCCLGDHAHCRAALGNANAVCDGAGLIGFPMSYCRVACDPIAQTGCMTGTHCVLAGNPPTPGTHCAYDGVTTAGMPCTIASNFCMPPLSCIVNPTTATQQCLQPCRPGVDAGMGSCPAGQRCNPDPNTSGMFGTCVPMS